jgi:hypothetical protein
MSTRRTPRFVVWPTAARWRAHQVGDHQQGPKTAYGEGDEVLRPRRISHRLGYPKRMKCPEVWAHEIVLDATDGPRWTVLGTAPDGLKQATDHA